MSKLNASDIQGFAIRGYNMPFARYSFLRFTTRGARTGSAREASSYRHHGAALGQEAAKRREPCFHLSRFCCARSPARHPRQLSG